jgi:hypothetical protein
LVIVSPIEERRVHRTVALAAVDGGFERPQIDRNVEATGDTGRDRFAVNVLRAVWKLQKPQEAVPRFPLAAPMLTLKRVEVVNVMAWRASPSRSHLVPRWIAKGGVAESLAARSRAFLARIFSRWACQ